MGIPAPGGRARTAGEWCPTTVPPDRVPGAENAAFSTVYFGGRLPRGQEPFKRGAMLGENFDFLKKICPKLPKIGHFWPFLAQKTPFFAILDPTPPTPPFFAKICKKSETPISGARGGCSGGSPEIVRFSN